jgi:hypothetical protein
MLFGYIGVSVGEQGRGKVFGIFIIDVVWLYRRVGRRAREREGFRVRSEGVIRKVHRTVVVEIGTW